MGFGLVFLVLDGLYAGVGGFGCGWVWVGWVGVAVSLDGFVLGFVRVSGAGF